MGDYFLASPKNNHPIYDYNIRRHLPERSKTIPTPLCQVYDLGLIEYEAAWRLQERLAGEIGLGQRPAALLLLEHPHTFTFGSKGKLEHLLWDEVERQRRGVALHWVDRGGDVTYHGPGQLVGYPLLPLGAVQTDTARPGAPGVDYVGYLRRLEAVLIAALAALGVEAHRQPEMTGVWVANPRLAKIAAIGVKVDSRGVSRHGFALNVNPDMAYWQGIVGCGLAGYAVTSLQELGAEAAGGMEQVKAAVTAAFAHEFGLLCEKNFTP